MQLKRATHEPLTGMCHELKYMIWLSPTKDCYESDGGHFTYFQSSLASHLMFFFHLFILPSLVKISVVNSLRLEYLLEAAVSCQLWTEIVLWLLIIYVVESGERGPVISKVLTDMKPWCWLIPMCKTDVHCEKSVSGQGQEQILVVFKAFVLSLWH